ncbi:hypothetical protein Tco_0915259 [Tanacetum coccineum]
MGNIIDHQVYFVEGMGTILSELGSSVIQNLEVGLSEGDSLIFCQKSRGVDLLKGNRSTNLYTTNLQNGLCIPNLLMLRATSPSHGLDLTYAPSTITTQKPTEGDLDLLFEAMYDDYIGGQPSSAPADTAPTPTNSSSQATNFRENTFVNPFATPSTSDAEPSSSQYVDPSNMHTFYQPYPHEFQWTKDHPLEQVIGEPSRPVLTRNQLRSDGDMCMYALTVSTVEPKNVKEAMTDPAWIESMQEELLQFKSA